MASAKALSVMCLQLLFLVCLLCLQLFITVDTRAHHHRDDEEAALNDVRALIQFKKCITSDPFSTLKDWNAAAPNVCNWTGIRCSAKHPGRVITIRMQSLQLRGSLPPHVANISFLQVLDIGNNFFTGHIPSSLGTLPSLKELDLCSNEFEGGIPYQLGNVSSLNFLALCANSLNGEIPPSLATLKDLTFFDVMQNQLGGQIPSWLGELQKLQVLELSENNMHGVIPSQLGNLSFLQHLSLTQNYLRGSIPCSLSRLHRLSGLFLEQTNLAGTIPPCLGNLTALTSLACCRNNFQGHLPAWASNFHKLQYLGLFGNNFTGGIPESWQNLTQLQDLQLSRNRLSGMLPSWLGRVCTQLQLLNLGQNYFKSGVSISSSQPIPFLEALSNCSRITSLFLYTNKLTGTLPSGSGNFWPKLWKLDLSTNYISGTIPESIRNLSYLMSLALNENMFNTNIPASITSLRSLQYLDLADNKLHGNIPSGISLLNKTLGYLYLSRNTLSGSIPASIGELVNLRALHVTENLLHGEIPSNIGNCKVLENLALAANNLWGAIPPEIAGLKSIIFSFNLSGNGLSGEVPSEIGNLQMAQYIDLSNNQLSGNIAVVIDNWLDAREINIAHNKFSGNLSGSIGNKLTQLHSIDLSHNNFTGSVPTSLFNLSHLRLLNFSYNFFDGEFPCLHSSSKTLKLSRWSLTGNPNLCGKCFDLRACQGFAKHHSSHSNKSTILKIGLFIIGGLLLLLVTGVLLFLFRRVKASKSKIPNISEKFLRISVEELQRATENFSDSNLVGEGTHGKVYRCDLGSDQLVAAKCFHYTTHRKSFTRECRALAKVRHRNILKIITVVWSEELKAIITPFMSNGSLHSLVHCRENDKLIPIRLPTRLRLLRELATALRYLHHDSGSQIIHGDVKPENVLLDDDMMVKLSDFGLARIIGDFDGSTTSSTIGLKGSAGYIAPEYGVGERLSVKGDVYSFGVVALEVITRLKPTHEMFSGDLTLPRWISLTLKGKSGDERRHVLKLITSIAVESGGGVEIDKEEELSIVESILMVGLRCSCPNASMRPDMKEVESILQSISAVYVHDHRILPDNLEEVIRVVETQPPILQRSGTESSTSSLK